jgi:hypothetical protein
LICNFVPPHSTDSDVNKYAIININLKLRKEIIAGNTKGEFLL